MLSLIQWGGVVEPNFFSPYPNNSQVKTKHKQRLSFVRVTSGLCLNVATVYTTCCFTLPWMARLFSIMSYSSAWWFKINFRKIAFKVSLLSLLNVGIRLFSKTTFYNEIRATDPRKYSVGFGALFWHGFISHIGRMWNMCSCFRGYFTNSEMII